MRSARFNLGLLVLVGILVFLQYRLWFDGSGIIDMLQVKKQLALQAAQNDALKKRNDKLERQLQYVQANDTAVEARARGELGMIKKGETFYQVVNK